MKQLRELHDATRKFMRMIRPEGSDLTKAYDDVLAKLAAANEQLSKVKSFEYQGHIKLTQYGAAIKLVGLQLDFDDLVRTMCGGKGIDIDAQAELLLVVESPQKVEADAKAVA